MTTHVHRFTALWFHWGPSKPQDVHVHQCFDERCSWVLVGDSRDCGGSSTPHRRDQP